MRPHRPSKKNPATTLPETKICCSVGVIVDNRVVNQPHEIGALLAALLDQHLHRVEIAEIIVIAGGCTDSTVAVIQEFAAHHPQIRLILNTEFSGRTDALNLFLNACTSDICVIEHGSTIPDEKAVEYLVRMFDDPSVGMVGAQKMAGDTPDYLIGLLSHLRLRMEHLLCLEIPRLSKMVAFRKVFDALPLDVAVEDALVEALVVRCGLAIRYAPDAIVYSTEPTTLPAFVKQRRENHTGYLQLKHKYGYTVSSLRGKPVIKVAAKELWGALRLLWVLFLLASLEAWSRILGWYDFAIRRQRHVIWDMAWTQKQNVESARHARRKDTS